MKGNIQINKNTVISRAENKVQYARQQAQLNLFVELEQPIPKSST